MQHYKTFLQQFKYRNKHTLATFNDNFNRIAQNFPSNYVTTLLKAAEYIIIFSGKTVIRKLL